MHSPSCTCVHEHLAFQAVRVVRDCFMTGEWHVWAQATVLDVLDQEGALHLLPSVQKAPSLGKEEHRKDLFMDIEPPAEVLRMYRRLLDEGSLGKAAELGSLPHSIATKWA